MPGPHEPRDGFLERLEWQIASEVRRRRRTGPAAWLPASRLKAAAVVGVVVLTSMAAGGAAVATALQAQDKERREMLASAYERRLELARERLRLASLQLEARQRRFDVGLDQAEHVQEERVRVAEAEQAVQVSDLELQEVRVTGREPLDEISAPAVSGRDFVMERLRARSIAPERSLEVDRQRLRDIRSRVDIGVANQADLAETQARVSETEIALAALQARLEIRRRFMRGEIPAAQAELRVLEGDAEQRVKTLAPRIALARKQVDALASKFELGLASHVQVAEARLRLSELQAELAKAELDLALIRKKIQDAGAS